MEFSLPDTGLVHFLTAKIDDLTLKVEEKKLNVARLTAERNILNDKVRILKEEVVLLVSSYLITFTSCIHLNYWSSPFNVEIISS